MSARIDREAVRADADKRHRELLAEGYVQVDIVRVVDRVERDDGGFTLHYYRTYARPHRETATGTDSAGTSQSAPAEIPQTSGQTAHAEASAEPAALEPAAPCSHNSGTADGRPSSSPSPSQSAVPDSRSPGVHPLG